MSNQNPIISNEKAPRWNLFQSVPTPRPGVALVLFRSGQQPVTLMPNQKMTAGEIRWGRYEQIYHVDVSVRRFSFTVDVPCRGDAFNFHGNATVSYAVSDPAYIVANNITEPERILTEAITATMRGESRRYGQEKSADAENAIVQSVNQANYGNGLSIESFSLELRLEEVARKHVRSVGEHDWNKRKIEHEHELAKLKMTLYEPLIQSGNWSLLAMQLANNPEDVQSILAMVNQQKEIETSRQLTGLKVLLDGGALEGWQLSDTAEGMLRQLVDGLDVKPSRSNPNALLTDERPSAEDDEEADDW